MRTMLFSRTEEDIAFQREVPLLCALPMVFWPFAILAAVIAGSYLDSSSLADWVAVGIFPVLFVASSLVLVRSFLAKRQEFGRRTRRAYRLVACLLAIAELSGHYTFGPWLSAVSAACWLVMLLAPKPRRVQ